MKIALLIPVYNAGKYLRECLESALRAGAELARAIPGATLEIRCCDDGSRDGSSDILRTFAARERTVHFVTQPNAGVVAARNRLLDELPADIDAFAFLDADDFVTPEIYARLAEAMERTQTDVAECEWKGEERIVDDMSLYVLKRTAPGRWITCYNKLYRRTSVGDIRFRAGLAFEEDYFYSFEVHQRIRRKVLVPAHCYMYRDNPDSVTSRLDMRRYFASATLRLRLSTTEFLATGRIPPALEGEFRAELAKDAYRMCVRKNLKKNADPALRRELFFKARDFLGDWCRTFALDARALNPIQRALFESCRRGRYLSARLLAALT